MPASDDDFFGLKLLESAPLPSSFHSHPPSSKKQHVKQKHNDEDIFEANFFSEIANKNAEEENNDKTKDGQEENFFEKNFARKTTLDPSRMLELQQQLKTTADATNTDSSNLNMSERNGIKVLWGLIDPVWKFGQDELVDYMAKRVIHETDDIIALDKPYQMAYSSAPKNQAQLDRIIQMLKKRIAPDIDRLYLVTTLDKMSSGVIIFAKNREKQQELKALLDESNFYFRFRCLCRNIPKEEKMRISIPLIKVMKDGNLKLCPLFEHANSKEQLYHLNTDCKLVNINRKADVSLIDAFARKGMTQVVRSHLYYGLDCPVIGDEKYARSSVQSSNNPILKTKLSPYAMEALELRKNDLRRLPMFMHLAEIHLPDPRNRTFSVIRSEIPSYFRYALRKLHLLFK